MTCGDCNSNAAGWLVSGSRECPTCRAPFLVSDEVEFQRLQKMLKERSPGRHTPFAQCMIAGRHNEGIDGRAPNHKKSFKWYQLAADQKHARAQYNLGVMYENGMGVAQSHEEAVKWFRLAADQGYATAQNTLGAMYQDGNWVSQSHEEAIKWYQLAATQGCAEAQCNIGAMYAKGEGVAQDMAKAIHWCKLAADQGHTMAQRNLAIMGVA